MISIETLLGNIQLKGLSLMEDPLSLIFIAILGLAAGSFVNRVITRLPKAIFDKEPFPLSVLWNPSWFQCHHCKKELAIVDKIPLLNYICLKGQCRYCKKPISHRYPVVEFLTCLLSLCVAFRFGISLTTFAALPLVCGLVALAFIDAEHFILPDSITLPLLGLGLLMNLFGIFEPFHSALLGAAFGYCILWGIYWIYRIVAGKEGLGQGDFKFFAMIGAWLGWKVLPLILLIAALLALLWGLRLMLVQKATLQTRLPFGVFLAISSFISLFWGDNLIAYYQEFAGI